MRNQSTGPSHAPAITDLDTATWRKSTRSSAQGSECVELARVPGVVGVRDSKNPHGPKLSFAPTAVRVLAEQIKRGDHDI